MGVSHSDIEIHDFSTGDPEVDSRPRVSGVEINVVFIVASSHNLQEKTEREREGGVSEKERVLS